MTFPTTGIGPRRLDKYRGWLSFDYLNRELQNAEDATLAHDNRLLLIPDRRGDCFGRGDCFDRPATAAERTLLAYLGFTLPDNLTCHVDRLTASVRRRRWPQLESQLGEDGSLP